MVTSIANDKIIGNILIKGKQEHNYKNKEKIDFIGSH